MGHVRYEAGDDITGADPAAELARRVFESSSSVTAVHLYSSMVTVYLSSTDDDSLEEVIEGLYTYYVPGVEIPSDEELIAMVE